jgi:hypothetical protein
MFDIAASSVSDQWLVVSDGSSNVLYALGGSKQRFGRSLAVLRSRRCSDVVIVADVRTRQAYSPHRAGVVVRLVDPSNFYALFVDVLNSSVGVARWQNGNETILKSAELPEQWFDNWIHLELRVTGQRLTGIVNGQMLITVMDTTHLKGRIGLLHVNGETFFDNVVIRQ